MKPQTETQWNEYTKKMRPILNKIANGEKVSFKERLFSKIYINRLKKKNQKL